MTHSNGGGDGELAKQRLAADAIERLSTAVIASENLDELLRALLAIFVEVAGVDVAVIRVREGDQMRPRAAVGPEDEVASGFTLRLVNGDELVGAIYVGRRDGRAPSDAAKQLARVLGARATTAIVHHAQRQALEQSVRSRDDVLSVVAHDLQNPINVISIAATSLLGRLPDSTARRPVERIIRGAQRADRLVRGLLEISAIESGRFSIEKRRIEPADLILSALESQQNLAADASVIIATDVSPHLPAIEADEERLLEVLENLVGNAIKFTSAGGTITVGAASQDRHVVVWVEDSGTGISAEQLPHIFDRFWQARQTTRRGTGLGLSICKGIVDAHGGRIWAESSLGVGTTLFFTIPAIPAGTTPEERVPVANILLVDDRPENLLALEAILEGPDYRLVSTTSGEEALRLALKEQFSVALIDVAMPSMNGLEVAMHLKELERSRDIPIIFVTAFGNDPDEVHRAYAAGGADYLVKPLDPEIVRKKVAVFVDLSRRRFGVERRRRERPART